MVSVKQYFYLVRARDVNSVQYIKYKSWDGVRDPGNKKSKKRNKKRIVWNYTVLYTFNWGKKSMNYTIGRCD